MSISVVKNNMYKSYSSCTMLENNINQLIQILNMVDESTSNRVSNYINTIDYSITTTKNTFNIMYQANIVELHILFSEFNRKSADINSQIISLQYDLNKLKELANDVYMVYKINKSMDFILDYFLSADKLRNSIPKLIRFRNELQLFKLMISTHNNKLIVGV